MNPKTSRCFSIINLPSVFFWPWRSQAGRRISSWTWTTLFVIAMMSGIERYACADPASDDPRILQHIQDNLGIGWYGVYIQKHKVGYAGITIGHQQEEKIPYYHIDVDITMIFRLSGMDIRSDFRITEQFEAQPPYALTFYLSEKKTTDEVARVTIERSQGRYEAEILQGGKTRAMPLEQLRYTLEDMLAVELWLQRGPEVGDNITYSELDEEKLQMQAARARVKSIRNTTVDGAPLKYYEIIVSDVSGLELDAVISSSGKLLSVDAGTFMTLQLEPKSLALKLDKSVDPFFENSVKTDRTLGDPHKVKRLKMTASGIPDDLIMAAPGQKIIRGKQDGLYDIEINPYGDFHVKATEDEIQDALAETLTYPIRHPDVVKLAKKAVGNTVARGEKVDQLTHFVYGYIKTDYHASPLNVFDIMAKKQGDCSEYATLFTTLARSAGIPARTVRGLVYAGDEEQAFVLHAWNEVVMDGLWTPVDASWNEVTINATHVRFPVNMTDEFRMMAMTPDIDFKIQSVELEKKD
ncbi:MAG: transglutaminase domain-containing protein [Gammaproteobacteria bacterium]|nr:transglutaminase domain-containing protein [Gammaproteobacteria bacterium]